MRFPQARLWSGAFADEVGRDGVFGAVFAVFVVCVDCVHADACDRDAGQ